MSDFEIEYTNDIVLFTVNASRATIKEADYFRKLIDNEIKKGKLKMIIDLSPCDFIDSTFIGVLVVTLKKLAGLGGELRLIKPFSTAHSILDITGTLSVFNTHDTKAEAVLNLLEIEIH